VTDLQVCRVYMLCQLSYRQLKLKRARNKFEFHTITTCSNFPEFGLDYGFDLRVEGCLLFGFEAWDTMTNPISEHHTIDKDC
jgi:hypothetical protein